jgi:hypothetical protein
MKAKGFAGALILVVIVLLFLNRRQLIEPGGTQSAESPKSTRHAAEKSMIRSAPASQFPGRPQLFKSTGYPPQSPAEKAMWEWWQAMEKTDSKFEWKMPIEFYGRVVDQFGAPVNEATVNLEWTVIGGTSKQSIKTAFDGGFSLQGARGKLLGVNIVKIGYIHTRDSIKSFEYAAFFQDNFHVPDPAHPVVFRLQKLVDGEPYYEYPIYGNFPANGEFVRLNIADGKLGQSGELAIGVRLEGSSERGPSYVVTVEARDGAGILATKDEFPFLAPETGYQNRLVVRQDPATPNYERSAVLKLFLTLPGGRYAYVGVTVQIWDDARKVALSGGVRFTENWTRNLESDHRKKINRL